MSTRGAIGRLLHPDPVAFTGRYHHADAHPRSLGKTLWDLYHGHFQRDLDRLCAVLIDEHPAGWSSIVGRDPALPVGYQETVVRCQDCGHLYQEHARYDQATRKMVNLFGHEPSSVTIDPRGFGCYCHGERHDPPQVVDEKNAASCGIEWVYAFDGDRRTMHVLASVRQDGTKMIGAFGQGDHKSTWETVRVIDLDGVEPDWATVTLGPAVNTQAVWMGLSRPQQLVFELMSVGGFNAFRPTQVRQSLLRNKSLWDAAWFGELNSLVVLRDMTEVYNTDTLWLRTDAPRAVALKHLAESLGAGAVEIIRNPEAGKLIGASWDTDLCLVKAWWD